LALMACATALAAPDKPAADKPAPLLQDDADRQAIFDRFQHRRHDKVFQEQDFSCIACHQVGGVADDRIGAKKLDQAYLAPPRMACHFCHNPSDGREPVGPGRCVTCHEDVDPPTSHGAGWLSQHGDEARMGVINCDNCHRSAACIECHDRREPIRFAVHDDAWLSIHAIAARANPVECSTCHQQNFCVACHSTANGRVP
ncbi:MAG: hypothetical protein GXP62_17050, partial [Oligoflexia bacterium]|nr:hypothetical protein [Oligoflexia bacterium]